MFDLIRNIALLLAILLLTGCGDNHYDESNSNLGVSATFLPDSNDKDAPINKWIGTWQVMKFAASNLKLVEANEAETLVFNPDGFWEVHNLMRDTISVRGIYQVFEENYIMIYFESDPHTTRRFYKEANHTETGNWVLAGDFLTLIDGTDYQTLKRRN